MASGHRFVVPLKTGVPPTNLSAASLKATIEALIARVESGPHHERQRYDLETDANCTARRRIIAAIIEEYGDVLTYDGFTPAVTKSSPVTMHWIYSTHYERPNNVVRFRGGFISRKLEIIREEIHRCLQNIKARCELEISDDRQSALEGAFVTAVARASLPEKGAAPQYSPREGIVSFLQRAWYDPWIAEGVFTRPYFRDVDRKGEMAWQNLLRHSDAPAPYDIPTKAQEWDRRLTDQEEKRSAWRVARAASRRHAKDGGGPER